MNRLRALVFVAGLGIACVPAAEVPYTQDLLLGDTLTIAGQTVAASEVHCPDTTHLGLALSAGTTLETPLVVRRSSSLHLEVCSPESGEGYELNLEVVGQDGAVVKSVLPLVFNPAGSFTASVDLSPLTLGGARLTLAADTELLLKDFYTQSQMALVEAKVKPRQVLLISIDTLREDAVLDSLSEYAVPHLQELISHSQTFSPHYAAASWTLPSQASILTGQHAKVHGLVGRRHVLRPGVRTLAERFHEKGFVTGALVYDCLWLDPRFGVDRGFETYRSVVWDLPKMARQASNWLVDHRSESFFFFFHSFDAHSDSHRIPYESPEMTAEAIAEKFSVTDYGCRQGHCSSGLLERLSKGTVPMLSNEDRILEHLYRRGVVNTDQQLGILFDNLRAAGLYDDLLIVLTSDHGESFEGPGRLLHGKHWQEVLRVPLVVKWPGNVRAGERSEVATSAIDLASTLAEQFGLDGSGLTGASLLALRPGRGIFSGTHAKVVVRDEWKAIFPLQGQPLLFDLASDPGERADVSEQRPKIVKELARLLQGRLRAERQLVAEMRRRGQADDAELGFSHEEIKRLEALGYVDGDG
jgi:arylsulfatase A-like enzyme